MSEELIALKCPNCNGNLEFKSSLTHGFCQYCGTKIMIPRPKGPEVINLYTDSSKFFLLICQNGMQEQIPVKDTVSIDISYLPDAALGDRTPMGLKILSNGSPVDNRYRLGGTGEGRITVSGIGTNLTLTRTDKIIITRNGNSVENNSTPIKYGDLFKIGNMVLRIQPMKIC